MLVAVEQTRHQISTARVNFYCFIAEVRCDITYSHHGILKDCDIGRIDLSRDYIDQLTIADNSRCWDLSSSGSYESCD